MSRFALMLWIVCSHADAFQSPLLVERRGISLLRKMRVASSVRSITDEIKSKPSKVPMTSLALIGSTTSDVLKVAAASLNCMRDATLTTMKSLNKLASGALEDQAIARRCKMLLSDDAKRLKLSVDEELAFAAGGSGRLKSFYMTHRIVDVRPMFPPPWCTLTGLKHLLRLRGLRVSGRKVQLVERLAEPIEKITC